MHCRTSSNIPGLYLQEASSTPSPAITTRNVPRCCLGGWVLKLTPIANQGVIRINNNMHIFWQLMPFAASGLVHILKLLIPRCPSLILQPPTARSRKFLVAAVSRALLLAKGSNNDIIGGCCFHLELLEVKGQIKTSSTVRVAQVDMETEGTTVQVNIKKAVCLTHKYLKAYILVGMAH